MKKFIAGLCLGLAVAATPAIAEWGFMDYNLLSGINRTLEGIHQELKLTRLRDCGK